MTDAATSRRARLGLLAAAAVLLLAGLGRVDAWPPDEPRYLQVAEELRSLEHGPEGLVLLHLDGRPYDQKPPLYFWLAALAGSPGGRVSEAAARLPSALAGLGCVALTLTLGARLFGGRVGLLGAALLLTTFEFVHLARRAQLDVLLALLETAALALFWRVDRRLGPRALQVAALHLCLGLGVLTKGPVAVIVPVLVMTSFLAWEGRLRELPRSVPLWALPLSLGPGLAWLAGASALGPEGFAAGTLGENLVGRFFAGTSHERPFYYYLYQLPADFLPWTLLAPALWLAARGHVFAAPPRASRAGTERRSAERDAAAERAAVMLHGERRHEGVKRAWRFLLAWVGASLVFFSLSSGKRGLYLLPAFPALALLLADGLGRVLAGRTSLPRALGAGLAGGALLVGLAGAGALGFAVLGPSLAKLRDVAAELERGLLGAFGAVALVAVAAGTAAWAVTRRHATAALRRLAIPVAGAYVVLLAVFLILYPALDASRSPRAIAVAAAAATPEGEPIGLVSDPAMIGGLAYYGGRRIVPLRSPESIRRFLDAGGRTFVVKERKLPRVTALTPVEVVARSRAGRRAVVVVVAPERVR
jgi:4-amino-4-deoxy-L-arabinose transferase-like glycosyltransferase